MFGPLKAILFVILSGLFAAMVAGTVASIVVTLSLFGPGGIVGGLLMAFFVAPNAIPIAGPVAVILGGSLWLAGWRRAWARTNWAWTAAGATWGLVYYLLIVTGGLLPSVPLSPLTMAGALMIAGIAAAHAFHANMRVCAGFLDPGDET